MYRGPDPLRRLGWILDEHVRPAVWGETVPLEVAAFHVDGEPVPIEVALAADYQPFAAGERWGTPWSTSWFRVTGRVPAGWAGRHVVAKLATGLHPKVGFGGEALVWQDGRPRQGLSWDHDEYPVGGAGEVVELYIEAAANPYVLGQMRTPRDPVSMYLPKWELGQLTGDLAGGEKVKGRGVSRTTPTGTAPKPGGPPMLRFGRADLVVKHDEVAALAVDLDVLLTLGRELGPPDRRGAQVLAALEESARRLDLDDVVGTAKAARAPLAEALAVQASSAAHRVTAVGHAHIDTAWLWPLRETRRKVARTFSSALRLMDEYPEYVFLASQPQHYAWMKESYPTLFARIRERVAEGRWEPVGALWVEADCNLPSGESLVRQLVHGKRFFRDELGVDSREVWLPDVFGYCAQLPQIMRRGGVERFLTQKLSWNDTNRPPHSTFWWEGIDGSAVLAHFPPAETYNGLVTVEELRRSERLFREHGLTDRSLYPFGHGDGGGGPSRPMLERARRLRDTEGVPRVEIEPAAAFFDAVEADAGASGGERFPRWIGELYFERHRGTYTTHADVKAGNRWGEAALHDAELWSAFVDPAGSPEVAAELDRAWKLLLLHQFHDILPGSSIHWVYLDAARDHAEVRRIADAIRDQALDTLAAQILPDPAQHGGAPTAANADADSRALPGDVVVFNALAHPRSGVVTLAADALPAGTPALVPVGDGTPDGAGAAPTGSRPVQCLHDGRWAVALELPAHGWATVRPAGGAPLASTGAGSAESVTPEPAGAAAGGLSVSERHLENERLRVEWGEDGQLASIFDKAQQREVVAPGRRANVFQLHPDRPENFDAWDIDIEALDHVEDLAGPAAIEVVDDGPLVVAVRFTWRFGASTLIQVVSLAAGSPVLDFATAVDWHEDHRLLKAAFPVDVRASRATFEVQYGHVERPTHGNTSWDHAQFEVGAHRWADLSETGFGVALLNDCKYGYDVKGGVLRLSLLRASTMPDPVADRGEHRFRYALVPHGGSFAEAGVIENAAGLGIDPQTRPTTPPDPHAPTGPAAPADVAVSTGPSAPGEVAGTDAPVRIVGVDAATRTAGFGGGVGRRPGTCSLVTSSSPGAVVSAVKRADAGDALVVRLYEAWGGRRRTELHLAEPVARAQRADLLEQPEAELDLSDGGTTLDLELAPFEIVTLLLTPG
jgi:alpha-mannosidase